MGMHLKHRIAVLRKAVFVAVQRLWQGYQYGVSQPLKSLEILEQRQLMSVSFANGQANDIVYE